MFGFVQDFFEVYIFRSSMYPISGASTGGGRYGGHIPPLRDQILNTIQHVFNNNMTMCVYRICLLKSL